MLCVCPKCGNTGTLKSDGGRIRCTCGLAARYTEYGFLESEDLPFDSIADWDAGQTEALCARALAAGNGEVIFSDTDITMLQLKARHGQRSLGSGRLFLFRDRLVCAGREFPLDEISGMGMHGPQGLSFTVGTEHFELASKKPRCLRKYMTVYDCLRGNMPHTEKAAAGNI
jgi:hypothetical protein